MAVKLFGDINTLQGGAGVQTGANPMQTGNPQQGYNPVAPVAPAPKPVAAPRQAAPRVIAPQPAPQVQPKQISQMFAPYVQTRPSPSNPGVLEYYNPQNGKGFEQPNDVFNYLRTMTGQSITDLKQLESQGLGGGNPVPQYGALPSTPTGPVDPNQSLAQTAGTAGIGYEDYLKIIQNQNGLSLEEKERIKQGLGIPDLESEIFKPGPSTESLYSSAYKTAGLGDLKSRIEAKLDEVNKIQSAFTGKSGDINENPWLSDASRTGRLRVLDDRRIQEIGNLNSELSSMKELYNAGVNEVNNLVTRQSTDFSNNQNLNSLKLQYLQGKAEEQIATKQNEKVSAAYSYLPDYLKAKAAAQKPDTIGSNETGYYRWNPSSGTFEQVIAPQVTPNYQANPLTGELFNTKDGTSIGGGGAIAGLAQAILQNPAAYSQLTTAQQGAVNNYFAQSGQPIPTQLTTEQKNKIASVGVLQQTITAIESLGAQLDWKGVGGLYQGSISQFLAKQFGKGSQQEQMLRSYIGNLQATIAKERGGTSFTANEQALLEQYAPTINDSPSVIQSKLAALKQYFSSSIPSTGGAGGGGANDPLGIRFNSAGNASASTPYLKTLGPVTGLNGSEYWANGLDVDLKKGDPVRSPVSGKVIAAAPNGGFGNQIKIKTTDGREIWLSHLDSGSVKVGQLVNAGQIIGIGGNSGRTIAGPGGDGSHLDITIKESNGKLLSAPQVKSYLDKIYV